jgi:mycofactocin precursor
MTPKTEIESRKETAENPDADREQPLALPEPELSDLLLSDDLIEDISIDGMCGVY